MSVPTKGETWLRESDGALCLVTYSDGEWVTFVREDKRRTLPLDVFTARYRLA
jgi:hypothetical protein